MRVVVRLQDVRNTKRRAGADEIVSTDFTGGMRIASAMVRPPEMAQVELGRLLPRSRDYMLMAAYENDKWAFNPPDELPVGGGVTLVLMADSAGRMLVEEQIRKHS